MRVECVAALAFSASARTLACKVMSPAFRQQWTSPSKARVNTPKPVYSALLCVRPSNCWEAFSATGMQHRPVICMCKVLAAGDLFYGAAWQTCPRSACGDGKGLANESGGVGQRLLFRVLSGLRATASQPHSLTASQPHSLTAFSF